MKAGKWDGWFEDEDEWKWRRIISKWMRLKNFLLLLLLLLRQKANLSSSPPFDEGEERERWKGKGRNKSKIEEVYFGSRKQVRWREERREYFVLRIKKGALLENQVDHLVWTHLNITQYTKQVMIGRQESRRWNKITAELHCQVMSNRLKTVHLQIQSLSFRKKEIEGRKKKRRWELSNQVDEK